MVNDIWSQGINRLYGPTTKLAKEDRIFMNEQ